LDKQETYGNIVRAAYPELLKTLQDKTVVSDVKVQQRELQKSIQTSLSGQVEEVIVDNDKSLHCIFCPECTPHLGDKIIAKSGKEGIKIHAMRCKALKTISYSALLEAHWKSDNVSNTYTLQTQLQFPRDKVTIVDIIALFSTFSIPIFKFELAKIDENHMLASIEGEVSNPAKLSFLFTDLTKNHSSLEVISKSIT
jgi:(p)ppGpp synthase/HD superfamily hydrolase